MISVFPIVADVTLEELFLVPGAFQSCRQLVPVLTHPLLDILLYLTHSKALSFTISLWIPHQLIYQSKDAISWTFWKGHLPLRVGRVSRGHCLQAWRSAVVTATDFPRMGTGPSRPLSSEMKGYLHHGISSESHCLALS